MTIENEDGKLDAIVSAAIEALEAKIEETMPEARLILMLAVSGPDLFPNTITVTGTHGNIEDEYDVQAAVVGLSVELARTAAESVGVGFMAGTSSVEPPAGEGPVMN